MQIAQPANRFPLGALCPLSPRDTNRVCTISMAQDLSSSGFGISHTDSHDNANLEARRRQCDRMIWQWFSSLCMARVEESACDPQEWLACDFHFQSTLTAPTSYRKLSIIGCISSLKVVGYRIVEIRGAVFPTIPFSDNAHRCQS